MFCGAEKRKGRGFCDRHVAWGSWWEVLSSGLLINRKGERKGKSVQGKDKKSNPRFGDGKRSKRNHTWSRIRGLKKGTRGGGEGKCWRCNDTKNNIRKEKEASGLKLVRGTKAGERNRVTRKEEQKKNNGPGGAHKKGGWWSTSWEQSRDLRGYLKKKKTQPYRKNNLYYVNSRRKTRVKVFKKNLVQNTGKRPSEARYPTSKGLIGRTVTWET